MNYTYLKSLLTLLFAIIINANMCAWANTSVHNYKLLLINKTISINNPSNNSLNTDYKIFVQRFTAVKRNGLNNFDGSSFAIKPIDNVRVFPNPVSTQINISYTLSKDNQVVIKILDILGNEILTLLNLKLQAGEQINSFVINSKIPAGFYFVRIVSGNDAVIKRITIV
jgi:hypothetical protein